MDIYPTTYDQYGVPIETPESSYPEPVSYQEIPEVPSGGSYSGYTTGQPSIEEAMSVGSETTGINPSSGFWTSTQSSSFTEGGYNPQASPSSGPARTVENSTTGSVGSFFSTLTDSLAKDMKEKPSSYIKMGLDGFASANASKNAKEAAALNRQSAIDQQNNAQALKDAENAKYNASFNNSKKPVAPGKKAPLTRTNGQRVFGPNGNIVR